MTTLLSPLVNPEGTATDPSARLGGHWTRRLRRADGDPGWSRPALVVLLAATAVLYTWGLDRSGYANTFYSAAVQAGTKSWKAFFFGASDAGASITVDKPPLSLWVMEISARTFGLSSWSVLVPQAVEGVAAVGLLHATVKRWFGAGAGLLAGTVLALTPVAVLMFRFNNPDALLALLVVGAAWAVTRSIDDGRTRWLVLAGGLLGLAFMTKTLQALLVVPALGGTYLLAGPPRLGRRIFQLVTAGVSLAVASLWWVAVVMAVPASARPYIGGSQDNSEWNLIFGYNGFGRLTGNETGSVGGGAASNGHTGTWGPTGILRLFNGSFGGQASWLLPAALLLTVAGLVCTARRPRTDRTRAALVLWGGSLVVTGAVLSLSKGIIHPYYTVALAPGLGATVSIGAAAMWSRRRHIAARGVLAAAVLAAAVWGYVLLRRTPSFVPWLRTTELVVAIVVAVVLVAHRRISGKLAVAAVVVACLTGVSGSAAYALETSAHAESGAIPSAGPAGRGGGFPGGFGGTGRRLGAGRAVGAARAFGAGSNGFAGRFGPGGTGPVTGGTGPAAGGFGPANGTGGARAFGRPGMAGRSGGAGGAGGLLDETHPSVALTELLEAGASRYTWVAAAVGSESASGYQLATGDSVMPIGGFNGTDPSPTLVQFERWVAEGRIHYFIAGGGFGGGGQSGSTSAQITSWIEAHYTAQTVGGTTLYDLAGPVTR